MGRHCGAARRGRSARRVLFFGASAILFVVTSWAMTPAGAPILGAVPAVVLAVDVTVVALHYRRESRRVLGPRSQPPAMAGPSGTQAEKDPVATEAARGVAELERWLHARSPWE